MINLKHSKLMTSICLLAGLFALQSCKSVQVPDGITVVENFDVKSYAGKWYEIARFDFKQEKDLSNVTADYSLEEDNVIKVVNKGFNTVKQEWKEAEGKAKFLDDTTKGALKVSFFGPFYSGYNIVAMEPDYKNALIFGETKDYIWFLSRDKTMSEDVKNKFLKIAKDAGYDLDRLVWTKQD